jgi:hypothetical protein
MCRGSGPCTSPLLNGAPRDLISRLCCPCAATPPTCPAPYRGSERLLGTFQEQQALHRLEAPQPRRRSREYLPLAATSCCLSGGSICKAVVAISFLASTALDPRVWSAVVATSVLAPTSLAPRVWSAVVATSFLTWAPLEPRLCSAVVAASLLPSRVRLAMSWTPCLVRSTPLGSAISDPSFSVYSSRAHYCQ